MKFAGPAVCFSGVTVYGDATGVKTLSPFEIDRGADEGVAIVIATNGHTTSAVIGGLMVATFYTLFFVPVTYSLLRRRAPRELNE